jgi:selenocysteine lyase/cysteine desulfurase
MTSVATDSRRRFIAGLGAASIGSFAHAAVEPNNSGAASSLAPAGQDISSQYLLPPGMIHLNTASLGATPRVVLDRTLAAWRELESSPVLMAYGNAENTVLSAVERVRKRAAGFLGCEQDELLITRCTTDAMSTVAQGMRWNAGERVLTTDREHDGGSLCWAYIAQRHGVVVDRIAIALDEHESATIVRRFAAVITPATRVISVSHVISSTGLRMPIAEISALARERGILCVVDGAQAVGAIPVNVKALGCHAYATSGHKWLMAPKGTGLLYVLEQRPIDLGPESTGQRVQVLLNTGGKAHGGILARETSRIAIAEARPPAGMGSRPKKFKPRPLKDLCLPWPGGGYCTSVQLATFRLRFLHALAATQSDRRCSG